MARESFPSSPYTSYDYRFYRRIGCAMILDYAMDFPPYRRPETHRCNGWESNTSNNRRRNTWNRWTRTIRPLGGSLYLFCATPPLLCEFSRCSPHSLECVLDYCWRLSSLYNCDYFYRTPSCLILYPDIGTSCGDFLLSSSLSSLSDMISIPNFRVCASYWGLFWQFWLIHSSLFPR